MRNINIDLETDSLIKIVELEQENSTDVWLALQNFYVITRYNHSHMYAMAVYQLSQKIKHEIKDYVAKN
jgi:membrane-bound lytic murein transglycosylase B